MSPMFVYIDAIETLVVVLASAFNKGSELISVISDSVESISASASMRSLLHFGLEGQKDMSNVGKRLMKEIQIDEFDPPEQYFEDSFNQAAIQRYLRENKFQVPIYMICGLKTAGGGATTRSRVLQENTGGGSVSGKLSVKGMTDVAEVQAAGLSSSVKGNAHDIHTTHAFIFAYRLREIKYDRKLKEKPYAKEVLRFRSDDGSIPLDTEPEDIIAKFEVLEEYSGRALFIEDCTL